ncbi:hypothetical protein ABE47_32175 [Bacillus thuringiensis]|nr:hypothetical protein [Bacillus thuringiensis]MBG9495423.1 hypothetical protein [Bacillus thuringiensis]MBG9500068.1 hypothetical protein [Bacillus thuringiensis]MBG9504967.1 hypothetical protein [Bacillus thuringiensis]MBG9516593.1 hypothetical protein [Bacillus thuringiensis]
MYFTLKKIGNEFVFTDICPELLALICQNREDLIGKTVDTAKYIGDQDLRNKLKEFYALALNQKRVLFYYFPIKNPEVFIITYLEPKPVYKKEIEIKGRCMPIFIKELEGNASLHHVNQFLVF